MTCDVTKSDAIDYQKVHHVLSFFSGGVNLGQILRHLEEENDNRPTGKTMKNTKKKIAETLSRSK